MACSACHPRPHVQATHFGRAAGPSRGCGRGVGLLAEGSGSPFPLSGSFSGGPATEGRGCEFLSGAMSFPAQSRNNQICSRILCSLICQERP